MIKAIAASVVALSFMAGHASALTITNKSSKEQTIGIDMGDKERTEKIDAGKSVTISDECKDGCGFTGPWGYSWMAKSGEDFAFDETNLIPAGS
jgi:hypothetical protein